MDTCDGSVSKRHMNECFVTLMASAPTLCCRSAFTMHVEAGHSAVPEEGPKDLRCPLCLYHTKYKRNMIDHIVLHRGKLSSFLTQFLWGAGGKKCGGNLQMLSQDHSHTTSALVPVPEGTVTANRIEILTDRISSSEPFLGLP